MAWRTILENNSKPWTGADVATCVDTKGSRLSHTSAIVRATRPASLAQLGQLVGYIFIARFRFRRQRTTGPSPLRE